MLGFVLVPGRCLVVGSWHPRRHPANASTMPIICSRLAVCSARRWLLHTSGLAETGQLAGPVQEAHVVSRSALRPTTPTGAHGVVDWSAAARMWKRYGRISIRIAVSILRGKFTSLHGTDGNGHAQIAPRRKLRIIPAHAITAAQRGYVSEKRPYLTSRCSLRSAHGCTST